MQLEHFIFREAQVNDATDMMHALGPWAGDFALTLFTLGIIGAGLSSIFPNLLLFPWFNCRLFEYRAGYEKTHL